MPNTLSIAFLEEERPYDGSQLSSHFAYRNLGLSGDSAVAFVGPCEVRLESMVDLEDVRAKAPIYSPKMLHLLFESFSLDLKSGVLLQRLAISQMSDELVRRGVKNLRREGDDLFLAEKKLSVSIATRSPLSTLIHWGLNIETKGTPVPTAGLKDWSIDPVDFAKATLESLKREYDDVFMATYKVRGVP